jgi:hypothetical protein
MTKKEKEQREELRNILKTFFLEKKVQPPITRKKVESMGYNMTDFLLELKDRLKDYAKMPLLKDFLDSCERLV